MIALGIIGVYAALCVLGAIETARRGNFDKPYTSSPKGGGVARARIVIEHRKRPWRAWVWAVEHSTARGDWWLWKQGYAVSHKAAHRKARRAISPPFGTPRKEELLIVRDFLPPKHPDPGPSEPLATSEYVGDAR